MYLLIRKNLFIFLSVFSLFLISIAGFAFYSIHQNIPILLTVKNEQPLIKEITVDQKLFNELLEKYIYIRRKKGLIDKRYLPIRYKKVTIILTSEVQPRFAHQTGDVQYAGSHSEEVPTELIIKLYLSKDYIEYWQNTGDPAILQKIINRLFLFEFVIGSPFYKDYILRNKGLDFLEQISKKDPPNIILLKN